VIVGALQVASEWWAWEICGLMVASLGTVELAVNSVLLSFSSILFQFPLSGGNAAANRIGNLLGANRPVEASLASKVALALAVGVSMFNRYVSGDCRV
jgi:MATE family multidrug resistance protein